MWAVRNLVLGKGKFVLKENYFSLGFIRVIGGCCCCWGLLAWLLGFGWVKLVGVVVGVRGKLRLLGLVLGYLLVLLGLGASLLGLGVGLVGGETVSYTHLTLPTKRIV